MALRAYCMQLLLALGSGSWVADSRYGVGGTSASSPRSSGRGKWLVIMSDDVMVLFDDITVVILNPCVIYQL